MMFNDPAETDDGVLVFELEDEAATERLAERLAQAAHAGDVIALIGELGAGKTALARAFIRYLSDPDEEVPSPTFTLLQTYTCEAGEIYHFDLYRLEDPEDAIELGIEDAFADGITLIEWADRLGDLLPADRLDLKLAMGWGPSGRRATLRGHGRWMAKLAESISEGAIHA